jgi:hypothetical protein
MSKEHVVCGPWLARWLTGDADEAEQAQIAALRLMADVNEGSGIALCLDAMAWISA